MNIANENKITHQTICEAECNGIEFELYGYTPYKEAPEVMQIAIKGIPMDLMSVLSDSTINSLQAAAERQFLCPERDEDQQSFIRELCRELPSMLKPQAQLTVRPIR